LLLEVVPPYFFDIVYFSIVLPKQSDFLMRDRAYSWDLNMEEQVVNNDAKGKGIAAAAVAAKPESSSSSSSSSSTVDDKKRKLDSKAAPVPTKLVKSAIKSPPLPTKGGSKTTVAQNKTKPPTKAQQLMDQNNAAKRAKISHPVVENKYAPQRSLEQYNMDMSMLNPKMIPGAMLGHVMPHTLNHTGQPHTLTRYDPISVHLLDHTGMMPALHPLDASCPRVGAYTKEERQVIIAKFRAKKMRRVWRKQIKYDCRKRLADTRPRVKGRFVSRKEREGDGKEGDGETASGDDDE
jgi:hypothetical protein